MDDDLLNLDVDTSYLRRVFGMLTAYVLLPDSNHASEREIDELDLAGRVHTLAAGRALWHLMGTSSERDDGWPIQPGCLWSPRTQRTMAPRQDRP